MSNISFWLNHCQSEHAYSLLSKYGYKHARFEYGDLGGLNIRVSGKFFEPDDDGDFYIAQGIWEEQPSINNPVDEPILFEIIVWHPARPRKWYFYRGETGLILGEQTLLETSAYREPLTLHSTPLSWLRAGCNGCTLLDHYGLNKLYGLKDVVCENVGHGTRIQEGLSRYYLDNMPSISVAVSREGV